MRFGGLRHTSTSCCVEGCEILSMRSSTSSRVHVNPSVRITYMSGAWSSDECSPTADASGRPAAALPARSASTEARRGDARGGRQRAVLVETRRPRRMPPPSPRSSAAARSEASDHPSKKTGLNRRSRGRRRPDRLLRGVSATLYTAGGRLRGLSDFFVAVFVDAAASPAACASRS